MVEFGRRKECEKERVRATTESDRISAELDSKLISSSSSTPSLMVRKVIDAEVAVECLQQAVSEAASFLARLQTEKQLSEAQRRKIMELEKEMQSLSASSVHNQSLIHQIVGENFALRSNLVKKHESLKKMSSSYLASAYGSLAPFLVSSEQQQQRASAFSEEFPNGNGKNNTVMSMALESAGIESSGDYLMQVSEALKNMYKEMGVPCPPSVAQLISLVYSMKRQVSSADSSAIMSNSRYDAIEHAVVNAGDLNALEEKAMQCESLSRKQLDISVSLDVAHKNGNLSAKETDAVTSLKNAMDPQSVHALAPRLDRVPNLPNIADLFIRNK